LHSLRWLRVSFLFFERLEVNREGGAVLAPLPGHKG
jgi:hypothetical protein